MRRLSDESAEKAREVRRVLRPGPVSEANPTVQCDTCPRVQAADMVTERESGVWECDACRRERRRTERHQEKRKNWS